MPVASQNATGASARPARVLTAVRVAQSEQALQHQRARPASATARPSFRHGESPSGPGSLNHVLADRVKAMDANGPGTRNRLGQPEAKSIPSRGMPRLGAMVEGVSPSSLTDQGLTDSTALLLSMLVPPSLSDTDSVRSPGDVAAARADVQVDLETANQRDQAPGDRRGGTVGEKATKRFHHVLPGALGRIPPFRLAQVR